jgi:hypothetical protein
VGLRDPAIPLQNIMIEKVVVNPQFVDALFTNASRSSSGIVSHPCGCNSTLLPIIA